MSKSQYWIVYYQRTNNRQGYDECVGTPNYIPCDKRYSIQTIIDKVMNGEYEIHKSAFAFNIKVGNKIPDTISVTPIKLLNK
jgi:hypothetical protein